MSDLLPPDDLHFSGTFLAALVSSTDDAVIGLSPDGRGVTWNQAAEHLYGCAAAEVTGRSLAFLIPTERPAEVAAMLARIRHGERLERYRTERIRKDGDRLPVSITLSPVRDPAGCLIGASLIAQDLRAQREGDADLERQRRASQAASAESEARLRSVVENIRDVIIVRDAQLLGRTGEDLFCRETAAAFIAHEREALAANAARAFEERIVVQHLDGHHGAPASGGDARAA